jgi:predicted PurR-regulated permease PerM
VSVLYVIFILIIVFLFVNIIPQIILEIGQFIGRAPQITMQIQAFITAFEHQLSINLGLDQIV